MAYRLSISVVIFYTSSTRCMGRVHCAQLSSPTPPKTNLIS